VTRYSKANEGDAIVTTYKGRNHVKIKTIIIIIIIIIIPQTMTITHQNSNSTLLHIS